MYPGAPYAPYQGDYSQNVGHMVNPELMYPQGYPQFSSPLVIAQEASQEASQGVQLPNHQANP